MIRDPPPLPPGHEAREKRRRKRAEKDGTCYIEIGPNEDGYEPPRSQKHRRAVRVKRTGTADLGAWSE